MTTTIHLEYDGKAARLPLQSPKRATPPPAVQRRTSAGAVHNVRVFNAAKKIDPKDLSADGIAAADPELSLSMAGTLADPDLLSTAFVDKTGEVVRDFDEIEVVLAPDGTEKERRPRTDRTANINDVRPIKVGVGDWYEPACNMQLCDGEHASLHAYITASTRRCTHATCDGARSTNHLRHHGDNVQS